MADLLNGILTEIGKLRDENQHTLALMGFYLPLAFYIVLGVISILIDYIMCTRSCPCIKCTRTQECLWPPGLEWNKTIIKLATFCGSILYYVGDNLEKLDTNENTLENTTMDTNENTLESKTMDSNDNTRIRLLTVSVVGLLLYRIAPVALKKLKRYCNKEENKPQGFNWCSPNSNETHTLVVAYTFLLTIVIDFDVVLTAVLNRIDDSVIPCNERAPSQIFWGLFGSMISFFILIELVIAAIFILTQCHHKYDCCEYLSTKVKLILSTRNNSLIVFIFWDVCLSIAVTIAVILFLLGDNEQVLECFIKSVPQGDESKYRIGFLLCSFLLCFLFVGLGFLVRKLCRCVQLKGNITSVDISADLETHLQVNVTDLTGEYTFTYNIITSKITNSEPTCNHAELYRNDIKEHLIVKYLKSIAVLFGSNGVLLTVSHRENQNERAVVYELDGHLYLIVYNTNNHTSIQINVIKLQPIPYLHDIPEDWVQDDNDPIVTYKRNNIQYSIYTYHRQLEEGTYAVQVEKECIADVGPQDELNEPPVADDVAADDVPLLEKVLNKREIEQTYIDH